MSVATFNTITGADWVRSLQRARATRNAIADHIEANFIGTMRRVCAWCDADLGTKRCVAEMDGKISHGICDACAEKQFPQQGAASEAGRFHTPNADGSTPSPATTHEHGDSCPTRNNTARESQEASSPAQPTGPCSPSTPATVLPHEDVTLRNANGASQDQSPTRTHHG